MTKSFIIIQTFHPNFSPHFAVSWWESLSLITVDWENILWKKRTPPSFEIACWLLIFQTIFAWEFVAWHLIDLSSVLQGGGFLQTFKHQELAERTIQHFHLKMFDPEANNGLNIQCFGTDKVRWMRSYETPEPDPSESMSNSPQKFLLTAGNVMLWLQPSVLLHPKVLPSGKSHCRCKLNHQCNKKKSYCNRPPASWKIGRWHHFHHWLGTSLNYDVHVHGRSQLHIKHGTSLPTRARHARHVNLNPFDAASQADSVTRQSIPTRSSGKLFDSLEQLDAWRAGSPVPVHNSSWLKGFCSSSCSKGPGSRKAKQALMAKTSRDFSDFSGLSASKESQTCNIRETPSAVYASLPASDTLHPKPGFFRKSRPKKER